MNSRFTSNKTKRGYAETKECSSPSFSRINDKFQLKENNLKIKIEEFLKSRQFGESCEEKKASFDGKEGFKDEEKENYNHNVSRKKRLAQGCKDNKKVSNGDHNTVGMDEPKEDKLMEYHEYYQRLVDGYCTRSRHSFSKNNRSIQSFQKDKVLCERKESDE